MLTEGTWSCKPGLTLPLPTGLDPGPSTCLGHGGAARATCLRRAPRADGGTPAGALSAASIACA
eukprot:6662594-Alexandrium_andersonii.AAC.1